MSLRPLILIARLLGLLASGLIITLALASCSVMADVSQQTSYRPAHRPVRGTLRRPARKATHRGPNQLRQRRLALASAELGTCTVPCFQHLL